MRIYDRAYNAICSFVRLCFTIVMFGLVLCTTVYIINVLSNS